MRLLDVCLSERINRRGDTPSYASRPVLVQDRREAALLLGILAADK